jgi:hypothetical protein
MPAPGRAASGTGGRMQRDRENSGCLEIYGEIAERNPAYLRRFDGGDTPDEGNDDASQAH